MAVRDHKEHRYRKPLNINIGMIIFTVFFVYLIYSVGSYMTKDRKQIYEVGPISTVVKDNTYEGLILRTEKSYTVDRAGYINLYVRESSRARVGETVYSIDENGSYTQLLNSNSTGTSSLSADQLGALKKKLAAFSASYDSSSFHNVYDAKYGIENLLMSYLSAESMENLEKLGIDTKYLTAVPAQDSGIVEYMQDGMESLTEASLTSANFNRANYQVNNVTPGIMLDKGAFVYKTITDETWYVYLPLTEDDQNDLREMSKVNLHFNDVNLDVAADFSMITTSDNMVLGRCKLSRYMIQLADRRYVSVTIKKSAMSDLTKRGLKIPKTAVVDKDFYVVPEIYATKGGNTDSLGFIRGTYTAEGTQATMIYPMIYANIDGYYYIDANFIEDGNILMMPDKPFVQEKSDEEKALEATNADAKNKDKKNEIPETEPEPEEESESETSPGLEILNGNPEEESPQEETKPYNPDMELDGYYDPAAVSSVASLEPEGEESDVQPEAAVTLETDEAGNEIIALPVSKHTYTLGEKKPLRGALCVNKGYSVFKQIQILDETDDYYIVSNGLSYGLSVYDHILLHGSSANEGDLIY